MKLVIAGSRSLKGQKTWMTIVESMDDFSSDISEIVSGRAVGVDQLGEKYARLKNIKIKEMPADWNRYGKTAGPIRNKEMAEYADAALIIWDGKSTGAKNMMENMRKLGKPYVLKIVEEEKEAEPKKERIGL